MNIKLVLEYEKYCVQNVIHCTVCNVIIVL